MLYSKYSDLNNLVEAIKFMYFRMERSSRIELIVLQPFQRNLFHLYTDTFYHKLIRTTDPIINDSWKVLLKAQLTPHTEGFSSFKLTLDLSFNGLKTSSQITELTLSPVDMSLCPHVLRVVAQMVVSQPLASQASSL